MPKTQLKNLVVPFTPTHKSQEMALADKNRIGGDYRTRANDKGGLGKLENS